MKMSTRRHGIILILMTCLCKHDLNAQNVYFKNMLHINIIYLQQTFKEYTVHPSTFTPACTKRDKSLWYNLSRILPFPYLTGTLRGRKPLVKFNCDLPITYIVAISWSHVLLQHFKTWCNWWPSRFMSFVTRVRMIIYVLCSNVLSTWWQFFCQQKHPTRSKFVDTVGIKGKWPENECETASRSSADVFINPRLRCIFLSHVNFHGRRSMAFLSIKRRLLVFNLWLTHFSLAAKTFALYN